MSGLRPASAQALVAACLLGVAGIAPISRATRNQSSSHRESASKWSASARGSANSIMENSSLAERVPFGEGELLNYRLTWSVFSNAATAQLAVVEKRDLFGTPTWHFRASAHTQVPLRSLAEIDDQFDSYADTTALESRQYETYLSEMGDKQNTILRLVSTEQPRGKSASVVLVKPHTRDPLAALYVLRAVDWVRTPEFRAPVYDGEDLYEMVARVEAPAEIITVAGGDLKATRVSVRLFRAGTQSRTKCSIWFSLDAARIPLVIQAEVPYGSVRADLISKTE